MSSRAHPGVNTNQLAKEIAGTHQLHHVTPPNEHLGQVKDVVIQQAANPANLSHLHHVTPPASADNVSAAVKQSFLEDHGVKFDKKNSLACAGCSKSHADCNCKQKQQVCGACQHDKKQCTCGDSIKKFEQQHTANSNMLHSQNNIAAVSGCQSCGTGKTCTCKGSDCGSNTNKSCACTNSCQCSKGGQTVAGTAQTIGVERKDIGQGGNTIEGL